jgi:uncharacterized protein
MKEHGNLLPAGILALGLIIAISIFSWAWSNARSADQTITVTGSARKEIVSDLGILHGTIGVQSATPEAAYRALVSQRAILLDYLAEKGFPADKVKQYPVTNYQVQEYDENGRQIGIKGYSYNQRVEVQSGDVKLIDRLSLEIASVVEQGVFFTVDPPEYHYTKLSNVKIEIQAEAAKDALVRADRIADATDRSLGALRSARMGVLQITAKNSNEVSDYGMNDVSSIEKVITAVVSASFQIR